MRTASRQLAKLVYLAPAHPASAGKYRVRHTSNHLWYSGPDPPRANSACTSFGVLTAIRATSER